MSETFKVDSVEWRNEGESHGVVEALIAADRAASAFDAWASLGPSKRRELIERAADALAERNDMLVKAMAQEISATRAWAQFNVKLAVNMLRQAAAMTTQISGEVIPSDHPDRLAMAIRQPAGVCLGIAPWNAPVILSIRAIAMPLACGNTVVLKASELCPITHGLVGQAMEEAGLNGGIVNVVHNNIEDAGAVVQALVEHPAVKRVNFTGSTRVGKIVGELAGRAIKPVLLELGGKAPLVVLRDADVEQAVNAAAFGAFMNQGQICMSTEKVVIDRAIADDFTRQLIAKASSLSAGDPNESDVAVGRLVNSRALQHVQDLLTDARTKGATVSGGEIVGNNIMRPAIVDYATPEMRIYHEETFGPIATVVRVDDVDEAIRVANDTEYGLAAAIFTKDIALALKLVPKISSGSCHINGPTVQDEAQMPFGGMKASGYGRFGGNAAIAEFTDTRWVTIETQPVHYPF